MLGEWEPELEWSQTWKECSRLYVENEQNREAETHWDSLDRSHNAIKRGLAGPQGPGLHVHSLLLVTDLAAGSIRIAL